MILYRVPFTNHRWTPQTARLSAEKSLRIIHKHPHFANLVTWKCGCAWLSVSGKPVCRSGRCTPAEANVDVILYSDDTGPISLLSGFLLLSLSKSPHLLSFESQCLVILVFNASSVQACLIFFLGSHSTRALTMWAQSTRKSLFRSCLHSHRSRTKL